MTKKTKTTKTATVKKPAAAKPKATTAKTKPKAKPKTATKAKPELSMAEYRREMMKHRRERAAEQKKKLIEMKKVTSPIINDEIHSTIFGILVDEQAPKPKPRNGSYVDRVTLYYVSGQWCICTLDIRPKSRYGQEANRTYAIGCSDHRVWRIGNGPHVKHRIVIDVHSGDLDVLQPLLDLKLQGEIDAHTCRDRRSSRSARSTLRWNW